MYPTTFHHSNHVLPSFTRMHGNTQTFPHTRRHTHTQPHAPPHDIQPHARLLLPHSYSATCWQHWGQFLAGKRHLVCTCIMPRLPAYGNFFTSCLNELLLGIFSNQIHISHTVSTHIAHLNLLQATLRTNGCGCYSAPYFKHK